MPERNEEQHFYQVGKITFIVTAVHKSVDIGSDKSSGETLKDILLKLMQADLERA